MQLRKLLLPGLLSVTLLSGCSLFNSEEDVVKMSPLPTVENQFTPTTAWSTSVGSGIGNFYSNLHPALADNVVYAADRAGLVKALNADIDTKYRKTKIIQYLCGIFTVAVALTIHTWVATMAWFTTYLGPRIGEEAAIAAVTAYQDGMLLAIAPMYVPMILAFGIHFVMLLAGKTRHSRWMLAFHPVTWNLLLVTVPDIAQAMQVPVATWMSVMSQSSTNSAIMVWCIAAAVYERSHTQ